MAKSNRHGKSACLTRHQLDGFLSHLPEKYALLAQTMYFLAGRVGETTSIKVRNINLQEGLITLEKSSTKTKETRQIPIPNKLMDDLRRWVSSNSLEDDDFVFFTSSRNTQHAPGAKQISNQSVDEIFRKTFDWIGIEGATSHSFRRSRLTHLMQKNLLYLFMLKVMLVQRMLLKCTI